MEVVTSRLRQFIEDEHTTLLKTLRFYLVKAGLASREQSLDAATAELLNEVVMEALQHEHRFWEAGQPKAWLLGIAANLIRRKQAELARRNRREPLVRDLYPNIEGTLSDDALFDWIAGTGSMETLEANQYAAMLVNSLSDEDQRVLRLGILHGMNGEMLAQALQITPGAARVRLHRALNRLRDAHAKEGSDEA